MKIAIGFILILGGIVAGLYVGGWVMFVGGIVQIIDQFKSPDGVQAMSVAVGLLKVVLAGATGWAVAAICALIGGAFLKE